MTGLSRLPTWTPTRARIDRNHCIACLKEIHRCSSRSLPFERCSSRHSVECERREGIADDLAMHLFVGGIQEQIESLLDSGAHSRVDIQSALFCTLNFDIPMFIPDRVPPGFPVMRTQHAAISYTFQPSETRAGEDRDSQPESAESRPRIPRDPDSRPADWRFS